MTLIAHGVPWSVAWQLEEYEIIAMIVAIGEAEGGVFNWDSMKWERPES
jgi:hypothetical protein